MIYLANAFSLQMVPGDCDVAVRRIDLDAARQLLSDGFVSAVGHADTAALYSALLGVDVPCQRANVALRGKSRGVRDDLVVGQITGGRLPEGSTALPDGVRLEWMLVSVRRVRGGSGY